MKDYTSLELREADSLEGPSGFFWEELAGSSFASHIEMYGAPNSDLL